MTFKEAKRKLKEVFEDKEAYLELSYQLTIVSKEAGEIQTCKVYSNIPSPRYYEGRTWEEAFAKLDEMLNPKPIKIEGAPE